ncbi:hypothetical protein [Bordetella genomosp. 7]|uniref:Lipoprotein n=1 Tax=Bordetella genomosp. 7 TaxID=1416805 RepID=A0A261QWL6_9BORD|nr:hypothetical protein [Bordetella genomosp. 7]OZI16483.1 hypothetical protein CAL19_17545 [Bordetella genomosp. 7]
MKSRFWRGALAAAALTALSALSAQAAAHGRYYGGYYGSGWWLGGAALLGTGVALALSTGPRYGYSGVTYVSPTIYYPPATYAAPVYGAPVYSAPAPVYAPPPVAYVAPGVATASLDVIAYPAKGQTEAQQARDRQECRRWAMNQSGFDPDNISEYTTSVSTESYSRAMGACFKGRGYTVN